MVDGRASAATAERVARESYGRLLAALAARTHDLAAAEDALSDAFAAALRAWPIGGAPHNPEAWLFAAANRKLIDAARRAQRAQRAQIDLERAAEEVAAEITNEAIPDRRLALLFACAHPEIEPHARTPLMLQTILGLSAERIAAAFMVEPSAMSQRLVRAKRRIRELGIAFEIPETPQWAQRLLAVLDAIYAAYTQGWSDTEGVDTHRRDMHEESVWLARVLVVQTPNEPEALGLLALILHLEARRAARRDASGHYVPLLEQDVFAWREDRIVEAERLLRQAARMGGIGRFQLEAAIQSAHARRRVEGVVDWKAVCLLYDASAQICPSPAIELNRCAARAWRDGPEAALRALEGCAQREPSLAGYQPYWALRADLCARTGQNAEACAAYDAAIAKETDPALIAFLSAKRDALS